MEKKPFKELEEQKWKRIAEDCPSRVRIVQVGIDKYTTNICRNIDMLCYMENCDIWHFIKKLDLF